MWASNAASVLLEKQYTAAYTREPEACARSPCKKNKKTGATK